MAAAGRQGGGLKRRLPKLVLQDLRRAKSVASEELPTG